VPQVHVRPVEEQEIRKARDGGAEVGLWAALPDIGKRAAVVAVDALGYRQLGRLEAGGEDERVDLTACRA
jgi:hypothetical protein